MFQAPRGRRARWQRASAFAAALSIAVLGAACSTAAANRSVASLGSHHHGNQTTADLTQAQSDRDFVKYAQCLRAHGLNEPDPFHRPGHVGLSISIPVDSASNRPALHACAHFIARIVQQKLANSASVAAPRLAPLTRYAICMRSHDIPMLDPDRYGNLNLGNVPGITSDFGRYSPQFRSADIACRHFLPSGVRDNGTGP